MNEYQRLSQAEIVAIDFDALQGVDGPRESPKDIHYSQKETYTHSRAWMGVLISGLLSFLGFALVDWMLSIEQVYRQTHPLYALLLAAVSLGFIGFLGYLVVVELRSYFSLSALREDKQHLHRLMALESKKPFLLALNQMAHKQKSSPYARDAYQDFFASVKPHHDLNEIVTLYHAKVTETLKGHAEKLLLEEAMKGGLLNALGPNTLVQTLLLFWVNMRVLKRIARLYGLRPGFFGGFRLLRIALENLAILAATDVVTDAAAHLMGQKALSLVTERGADALMAWKLTLRLGEALIDELDFTR
jgi:putative membrane protein